MDNYPDPLQTDVAIGIIRRRVDDCYLIARRQVCVHSPDLWEFPGGKLEQGETVFMGLARELNEEIGIQVLEAEAILCIKKNNAGHMMRLHVMRVLKYQGEPYGKEGQLVRWVNANELSTYQFLEANAIILAALGVGDDQYAV